MINIVPVPISHVRESTKLSKPLQNAVKNGSVKLERMSHKSIKHSIRKVKRHR